MRRVEFETNPLDHIPPGERWIAPEGQTRILGPILAEGELLIDYNAHLVVEE